jgi:hypothetical protein
MKIIIAMDGDGHFMAAPLMDREKVSKIIEKIQDGDFVANMDEDDLIVFNYPAPVDTIEWRNLIQRLEQRGTLEIFEL